MNRREAFKVSAASIVGFSLGFFGGRATITQPPNNIPLNVSTNTAITVEKSREKLTFGISDSKQFWHYIVELARRGLVNRGYDVEMPFLDPARAREAFAARRVEVVTTSPIFLMTLAEQGEKVFLGPAAYINLFVIVARKDFDVKNLSRPLNIGVSMLTSIGHFVADQFIKEMNITQANWAQIGRSRERIAALLQGSIDLSAVTYEEAYNSILSGAEIKIVSQPFPFWVTFGLYQDWVKQKYDLAKDLVKSLIVAKAYCSRDRQRRVDESIKYAEIEPSTATTELVRRIYEFYDKENFWATVLPPDSFYENTFRWSVENNIIRGDVDFRSISQPVKELAENAFEELLRG